MSYFSSLWFKVSIVILVFLFAYGIFAYFMVAKKRTDSLTDIEKSRLRQALPKAILVCKILFFMLPIYLLLIHPIYKLDVNLSYEIMFGLTIMYAGLIEGFFVCKRLLDNLGK